MKTTQHAENHTNSLATPHRSERVKSIGHALELLNEAADDSVDEIKQMVSKDLEQGKEMFQGVTSEVSSVLQEVWSTSIDGIAFAQEKVVDGTKRVAKKVDESVHHSPWAYLLGTATAATLVGFALGRKSKH